jgi:hypothetical protein
VQKAGYFEVLMPGPGLVLEGLDTGDISFLLGGGVSLENGP